MPLKLSICTNSEAFLSSIRIIGRVPAGAEEFLRRRNGPDVGVDESNVRSNDGHAVGVGRVAGLAVDELKRSGCSIACALPDEYADRVVGPGQACHRQSPIDLEILSACTLKVSGPACPEELQVECII